MSVATGFEKPPGFNWYTLHRSPSPELFSLRQLFSQQAQVRHLLRFLAALFSAPRVRSFPRVFPDRIRCKESRIRTPSHANISHTISSKPAHRIRRETREASRRK